MNPQKWKQDNIMGNLLKNLPPNKGPKRSLVPYNESMKKSI